MKRRKKLVINGLMCVRLVKYLPLKQMLKMQMASLFLSEALSLFSQRLACNLLILLAHKLLKVSVVKVTAPKEVVIQWV